VNRKSKDGTIQQITCPELINIYNMNMKCVDHFDQLRSLYKINRKSKKWWHCISFFFPDAAVFNAFILHKKFTDTPMKLKDFRREVIAGFVAVTWARAGPYLRTGPWGPGPGRQIFRGGIFKKSRLKYGMRNKKADHERGI
jgi:hypothetical protein